MAKPECRKAEVETRMPFKTTCTKLYFHLKFLTYGGALGCLHFECPIQSDFMGHAPIGQLEPKRDRTNITIVYV